MRLNGRSPSSGRGIGILGPFDVWSAGIEAIIRQEGWPLAGRWRSIEVAMDCRAPSDTDVVIVAKRLVARPAGVLAFRPFKEVFAGPLILAIEPDDDFAVDDFLALDVEGLLLSAASLTDVIDCLETVMNGGRWVDPNIRTTLGQASHRCPSQNKLSMREQQVAQLAASGLSNKGIARVLRVSGGTVKMHMHHILSKLQMSSRMELIRQRSGALAAEFAELPARSPFVTKLANAEIK